MNKNNVLYMDYTYRKRLGVLYPNKSTFRSWRSYKKHFFRAYNGWGVNYDLLEYLKNMGVKWFEIEDTDNKVLYRTTVETIDRHGIVYDNNGEYQKVLPLNRWTVIKMAKSLLEFT